MKNLKINSVVVILTLLVCRVAASGQISAPNLIVPKGWKKVEANGLFSFYLPPGARQTDFTGVDSFYREWRIGKMRFMFVHQPNDVPSYEDRQKIFGEGFQEKVVEVDGRKAYLFAYVQAQNGRKRYYVDLYVGDLPNAQVMLWLQADSYRLADLGVANKVFRTVEFP